MPSVCRRSGWRRSFCEPLEIGEPDLDERPDRILETRLAGHRESLLVGLSDLLVGDPLLEPVVPRHEQLLDSFACVDGHLRSVLPLLPLCAHAVAPDRSGL